MTEARWAAERRKMSEVFPWFCPIESGDLVGFKGPLAGPAGLKYAVEILASRRTYPAVPPRIWIHPSIGSNRLTDGSLCIERPWRPDRDTFAQHVVYAAAYLAFQRKMAEPGR